MINNYTTELLNEGLFPKTVKDILIILKQILSFANINIKIAMPKVPKNEIQILEKQLLANMTVIKFGIYFCLYTGLRIGEICALRWENIDIDNRKTKIRRTITRIKNPDGNSTVKTVIVIDEPKSISSIREIPIPEFLVLLLMKFSKNVDPTTFLLAGTDKFMETRTYFNKYKKIDLTLYNFHALRHTFATRCVEGVCDPKTLSEISGRSNVAITLERYVHPNYENKVKMMNQLKTMYN